MSVSIDPTDYVEAPEGTLLFSNELQQAKFELGVCMAIYKWEELTTAVDNQWGGANSADKRDWISGVVIDLFKEEKIVDIQLIEETLLYAMVDEFDTEIDNDLALEIAALVFKVYQECAAQNYATVEQMYNAWQEKQANRARHVVLVEADPNNPDDSSSEDEDDEEEHSHEGHHHHDDAMEVDEPQGPVVDDDGFQMVQPKRKGRR